MPEWLNDLILAVGGGSVVLIGIFTVFKKLLIKYFTFFILSPGISVYFTLIAHFNFNKPYFKCSEATQG